MYSTRNRDTAMLWKQYKTKVLQNNFKGTLVPRTTVTKKNALISIHRWTIKSRRRQKPNHVS